MLVAAESPCEPSALAAAVRTLARDAHLALRGPHTESNLRELARRAEALKGCVAGPLGPWLDNLASMLGHAEGGECTRGPLPFIRGIERAVPASVRAFLTGHPSELRRESA